ncbi:MerR family transcriptional regulator, partial [Streptomyces sp. NPDC005388]|uniref:MerR family transcriptional regulator n=1 Tax=Streptomyces sp. NPDC005388 TaxID=3156717 RepID=UPI0033BBC8C3
MLIGELAAQAGTTTRALRYYEEQGLLESDRTAAGYRLYEPGAVRRVRNIRELLSCGLTVEDVKSLLAYLDADLPEVLSYSPLCADDYGSGSAVCPVRTRPRPRRRPRGGRGGRRRPGRR